MIQRLHHFNLKGILRGCLLAAGALLVSGSAFALPAGYFSQQSLFSTGKWVKIAVDKTGLYEVTYDELRAMGFASPEKVGLFGNGATKIEEDFTDSRGNAVFPAQAQPVPVLHANDKLIFFGQGPENIVPKAVNWSQYDYKYTIYTTNGRNIYTDYGWYFLTDTSMVPMEQVQTEVQTKSTLISSGISYLLDDAHNTHNSTLTGRTYFNRMLFDGDNVLTYTLPRYTNVTNITLESDLYAQPIDDNQPDIYSINFCNAATLKASSAYYEVYIPTHIRIKTYSTQNKVSLRINKPESGNSRAGALGYVLLGFFKNLATSNQDLEQDRLLFSNVKSGETAYAKVPAATNRFIDITDPNAPKALIPTENGGNRYIYFTNNGSFPDMIHFDLTKELYKPAAHYDVTPDDVRTRLSQDADMLIVTVHGLREKAEELAEVHRRTDGVRCVVVTVSELYNEFTSGTPDPMAIRAAVKMMKMREGSSLKNILLFGPYSGNVRNIGAADADQRDILLETDPNNPGAEFNSIIAYQVDSDVDMNAYNDSFAEFYGITADYNRTADYRIWNIDTGVGVLPVNTLQEADLIIKKIEDFLTDDEMAYRLNSTFAIGCHGDLQSHGIAATTGDNNIKEALHGRNYSSTFLLEAYPQEQWVDKFYNTIAAGHIFGTYFGHGSLLQLSEKFITKPTLVKFKNSSLPFMCLMACELTSPDRLNRGIGEEMILGSKHGLVGGLVSIRETSRNSNSIFFNYIIDAMLKNSDGTTREQPLTLGETIAAAKTRHNLDECGRYLLICDPSLRLPFPTLGIDAKTEEIVDRPGYIKVTGQIVDNDEKAISDFNGHAVVRIMETPTTVTSANYVNPKEEKLSYSSEDKTLALQAATVADGKFTAIVPVSAAAAAADGLHFAVSAYDRTRQLGAGVRFDIENVASDPDFAADTTAPTIEVLAYDEASSQITFTVSDDKAILPPTSGFDHSAVLTLDGRQISDIHLGNAAIDSESARYTKRVALPYLTNGQHHFILTVSDMAGNTTAAELAITIGARPASLALILNDKVLHDQIDLQVTGADFAGDLTLYIEDSTGRTIASLPIGDNHTWDGKTSDGTPLTNGVYRLHVKGSNGHFSDPVDLPILR